ncbi:MAG: alcohol dehydrogenase catalytic domain-containing protein, partial [Roseiarcus sp.]
MKAIVFNEHGESDVLQYAEGEEPRPAAGEALVAVGAVAVNHGPDVETRRRGFMMGDLPMPHIGGTDPAGGIVELGPRVSDFSVGDRVA